MEDIYYDITTDTWHFKLNKKELKKYNVTVNSIQTGEFDIQGIINSFCKNSGENIKSAFVEMSASIDKTGGDFELKVNPMSKEDIEDELYDIFTELSDEDLDAIIEKAGSKKKDKNAWWSYSFETMNFLIPSVKGLSPIPSTLVKLKGIYYLYGKGNDPHLEECGEKQEINKMKEAYFKEHGICIIKDNAIETLNRL